MTDFAVVVVYLNYMSKATVKLMRMDARSVKFCRLRCYSMNITMRMITYDSIEFGYTDHYSGYHRDSDSPLYTFAPSWIMPFHCFGLQYRLLCISFPTFKAFDICSR